MQLIEFLHFNALINFGFSFLDDLYLLQSIQCFKISVSLVVKKLAFR